MRIAIDAGHGYDPKNGYTGASHEDYPQVYHEDNIVLGIAHLVAEALMAENISAMVVRPTFRNILLGERVRRANQYKADFFLSIHCNSAPNNNPQPHGFEAHIWRDSIVSGRWADIILDEFQDYFFEKNMRMPKHGRRFWRSDLYVLKHTEMPAVLFEIGFMSNPEELSWMIEERAQIEVARALTGGVVRCKREIFDKKEEQ